MKKVLQVVLISMLAVNAHSISLEGTWQEDKDRTIQWNSANTKVDPERLDKLGLILGHYYIKYKNGMACGFFEPYTFEYEGEVREVPRLSTNLSKYEVVAENEFGYVIKTTGTDQTETIDVLIFEGEESFYGIRLDAEDFGFQGGRIYFKKVETVRWDFDCAN
ncbi:hypothetical protein [Halopseudomonas salegens]|uniref:hypothetical protein n=1 Tax=Halopseudomonas salegens TaxID=1434072 RepID=UPI0012FDC200|nr:hypothetical protein [Halopseudomonas salegens]